jgi:hypothetical protein
MVKGKKMTHKERVEKLEKDKIYRQEICRKLCAHLANGYSFESFTEISIVSLKKSMVSYPEDYDEGNLQQAIQQGRDMWETIGKRQASGDCLGNSRSWWLNMAHRYKWSDRVAIEAEHKGNVNVNIVSYATSKGSKDTSQQTNTIT